MNIANFVHSDLNNFLIMALALWPEETDDELVKLF